MRPEEFTLAVDRLSLGKRLPDGVYAHVSLVPSLPNALREAIFEARRLARLWGEDHHVIKFATSTFRVSLLAYPRFFEEAFPALTESIRVDLEAGEVVRRRYAAGKNPPILHRKERMLPPDHPRIGEFLALTREAERLGLFEEASAIGTKRPWEMRLARLGIRLDGHRIYVEAREESERVEEPSSEVKRHKTALQRYRLSTPVQALYRYGQLQGGATFFDYGCGRGDDVRILKGLGVEASGWDPHFAAEHPRVESDVVNLGFVINVIEDVAERRAALEGAYSLARRVLAVAALLGGRTAYEQHRLFRDGVLTERGTFQKYFSQHELRSYLEGVLGREPIAVAPGIFFVFRDDAEEQRFLAARQTSARCLVTLPKPERAPRDPRPAREPKPSRWDQHRELLDGFWASCLALGRLPAEGEFDRLAELRSALGAPKRVLGRLQAERGEASIEDARRGRMDDLLVYLALNLFERRRSFKRLPEGLQRDIAGFWGSYAAARDEATKLLFSLGRVEVIHEACVEGAKHGYLDGSHSLQLHASRVPLLPAVLRVYVGCASRLYGEVESSDVVKIHVQSGKLSLMTYDDFMGNPLPKLLERVKIDMRSQRVMFFDYGGREGGQVLFPKSRYLSHDFEGFEEQQVFERALEALDLPVSEYGLDVGALGEALDKKGLSIEGFRLVKR